MFLNFPVMDMNAIWRNPDQAPRGGVDRMNRFWGDESWKRAAYSRQGTFFGEDQDLKLGNTHVVEAFTERLKSIAGFEFVPKPLPMLNSTNAIVYYLFFASHQPVASRIVQDILDKYRNRKRG